MNTKDLEDFAKFFNSWYDLIFGYAIVIAAVGTLSMALVEGLKSIFRLRGHFLKYKIEKWISIQNPADKDKAKEELLCLAAGDSDCNTPLAWWDQPEERVFPRIHSAAETALDFPNDYPCLYEFLTRGLTDREDWKSKAHALRSGSNQAADRLALATLTDIRVRLGSAVTRRIETLQMQVESHWNKVNQVGAFLFSIMIFVAYSCKYQTGWVKAVGTGVLAGFLAPFAKDLVSRISEAQLRNRL